MTELSYIIVYGSLAFTGLWIFARIVRPLYRRVKRFVPKWPEIVSKEVRIG